MDRLFKQHLDEAIKKLLAKGLNPEPMTLDQIDPDLAMAIWPFSKDWNDLDVAAFCSNPFVIMGYYSVIGEGNNKFILCAGSEHQTRYAIVSASHMLGIPCSQETLDNAWIRPLNKDSLTSYLLALNK